MGPKDCAASYTAASALPETKAPDSLGGTTVSIRLSYACFRRYIQSSFGTVQRIQRTIEIYFLVSARQSLLGSLLGFTTLPITFLVFVAIATGTYLLLVEGVKRRLMRSLLQ